LACRSRACPRSRRHGLHGPGPSWASREHQFKSLRFVAVGSGQSFLSRRSAYGPVSPIGLLADSFERPMAIRILFSFSSQSQSFGTSDRRASKAIGASLRQPASACLPLRSFTLPRILYSKHCGGLPRYRHHETSLNQIPASCEKAGHGRFTPEPHRPVSDGIRAVSGEKEPEASRSRIIPDADARSGVRWLTPLSCGYKLEMATFPCRSS